MKISTFFTFKKRIVSSETIRGNTVDRFFFEKYDAFVSCVTGKTHSTVISLNLYFLVLGQD